MTAKKLSQSGKPQSELEIVERLISDSTGARDFLAKALRAGFKIEGEDYMGMTITKKKSMVLFNVLASYGSDKIFTLVFREGDYSKTLIREGEIV